MAARVVQPHINARRTRHAVGGGHDELGVRRVLDSRLEITGHFGQFALVSIIVTTAVVAGSLIVNSMAAYSFARMKWRGKKVLISIGGANGHGNARSVAEHTFGLMLGLSRRMIECDRKMHRTTALTREEVMGHEITGKTLGLVGIGQVGTSEPRAGRRGLAWLRPGADEQVIKIRDMPVPGLGPEEVMNRASPLRGPSSAGRAVCR